MGLEADRAVALNGQAMDAADTSRQAGPPWRDAQRRIVQLGRDVLGLDVTSALIDAGLQKCP